MSTKHTPGPWMVNDSKGSRYIENGNDDVIAQVFRDGRGCFDADARLIASAPRLHAINAQLLEALRECLKKGSKWHPCDPVVVQANAAIRAAEGEKA